jgi:adenylosuccinate synthase
VFDPGAFKEELDTIGQFVSITPDNLKISENCALITSYNKLLDQARESMGGTKIGTTGRGIGPTYEDKISRRGLKLRDLLDKTVLAKKLRENLFEKEFLFKHLYQIPYPSVEEEVERLHTLGETVAPFLGDTFNYLDDAFTKGKKILYEGAQGVLLDIDYGTYPFVTSSNTSLGGIYTGAGVGGKCVDEVLGIAKAYTTRVGHGPFPTELFDDVGERIQTTGKEFGATTGRKRRCGWIDIPLLRYATKASGLTSLALTKIDVLSGLWQLRICHAYLYKGKQIDCAWPGIDLTEVKPLYTDMMAFHDDFSSGKSSPELEKYIKKIEELVGIPVGILAYGPERKEIIFRKKYF